MVHESRKSHTRNSFRSWASVLFIYLLLSGKSWLCVFRVSNSITFSYEDFLFHRVTLSWILTHIWFDITSSHVLTSVLLICNNLSSFIFPSYSCLFHLFRPKKLSYLTFDWNMSTTKASGSFLISFCDLWSLLITIQNRDWI